MKIDGRIGIFSILLQKDMVTSPELAEQHNCRKGYLCLNRIISCARSKKW